MQQSLVVQGIQRFCHVIGNPQGLRFGHPSFCFQDFLQVLAANVFHGDEMLTVVAADFVGRHEIGMRQLHRQFGFLIKSHENPLIFRQMFVQDLEGHDRSVGGAARWTCPIAPRPTSAIN